MRDTQGPGASTANDFADAKFPGQTPLAAATAASEFRNQRAEALARGEVPNFEDSPEFDRVRAQFGDAEAENFLRDARRQFFDEFEAQHGTEALLSTLRGRQAAFTAEQRGRDRAREAAFAEQARRDGVRGLTANRGVGLPQAPPDPALRDAAFGAFSARAPEGGAPGVPVQNTAGLDGERLSFGSPLEAARRAQLAGAARREAEMGEAISALPRLREGERISPNIVGSVEVRARGALRGLVEGAAEQVAVDREERLLREARERAAAVDWKTKLGRSPYSTQPFATDAAAAVDRAAARLGNNSRR